MTPVYWFAVDEYHDLTVDRQMKADSRAIAVTRSSAAAFRVSVRKRPQAASGLPGNLAGRPWRGPILVCMSLLTRAESWLHAASMSSRRARVLRALVMHALSSPRRSL